MRRLFLLVVTLFALYTRVVHANTEKVIFIAPPAPLEPLEHHHAIETLSPSRPAVRRVKVQLSFEKPTEEFFVLEQLDIGRKYEVRVCWPASVTSRIDPVINISLPRALVWIIQTDVFRRPLNSILSLNRRIVQFPLEDE